MRRKSWRKIVSTTLSMIMCGSMVLPALSGSAAAVSTPIKIACIGDSVTYGIGGTSYPTQLQQKLGNAYEVKNFGLSGATAQNHGHDQSATGEAAYFGYRTATYPTAPDWMDSNRVVISHYTDINGNETSIPTLSPNVSSKTVYEQSQLYQADIYIIAIGGNDSKHCNQGDDNTFKEDYRSLVEEYVNLPWHPLVIIGTSPAMAGHPSFDIDALANSIVPFQRQTAEEMGLPFADTFTPTSNHPDEYFIDDGVHLNTTGYGVIASVYEPVVRNTVSHITAFHFENGGDLSPTAGVINDNINAITVTVAPGTDITALKPVVSLERGATYVPAGSQDFTNPITYTVTGADGKSTRTYTVTVKVLDTVKIACVGDSLTAANRYPVFLQEMLGEGYEVKNFGVNSTTAQKDGLKENKPSPASGAYIDHPQYQQSKDFAPNIVLLTLGSNDSKQGAGQQQSGYDLVTNWKADSPVNYERDLKELVKSYQDLGAIVVLGTSPSGYVTEGNWAAKPEIVNTQIAPIQRKVAAEMGCFLTDFNALTQGKENTLIGGDGLHPNDTGYQLLAEMHYEAIQNAQAAIFDFTIEGAESCIISQSDKTIYVTVPDGTDLTALTPTLTLSDGALCDKSGSQNFGRPVTYTVTSAGGWVNTYTVAVSSPSGVSVAKIEMLTQPEKTTYLLGEQLDLTGAALNVIYTDGSSEIIPVTPDMVSGYDWLTIGKQALTVTYGGKTATLNVQVHPYGVLGTFSAMSGRYDRNSIGSSDSLLYADWKWADKYPIDLSSYGDRSSLRLEMDIAANANWNNLIIKLRSADKYNVEGDPEAGAEPNKGNSEHNYGWNLTPQSTEIAKDPDTGLMHLSIPLDKAANNHKGVMDWSTVGRLIVQCGLTNSNSDNQQYMDISNVYIVDNAQKPTAPDTTALQAAVNAADQTNEALDESLYTPESVQVFQQALALATAYLQNPYATQTTIDQAITDLSNAQKALTGKTVRLGDVNEDGRIDIIDALMALQAASGKIKLNTAQAVAACVSSREKATPSAFDALLILKHATKQISAFPAGETVVLTPNPNPDPDDGEGLGTGDGADDTLS